MHFADGTVRTIDTIVYATGFKATLPFLDPTLLSSADGVPLRVAGMTLPVGLERLYFVGLAAPRGPQLPVYSAQARLIAQFLTAQERTPSRCPRSRARLAPSRGSTSRATNGSATWTAHSAVSRASSGARLRSGARARRGRIRVPRCLAIHG